MDYWRLVLRRAVRETARDTKLDTGAGAMMVLVGTVLVALHSDYDGLADELKAGVFCG